jgi:hypothetical protein
MISLALLSLSTTKSKSENTPSYLSALLLSVSRYPCRLFTFLVVLAQLAACPGDSILESALRQAQIAFAKVSP